MRERRPLRIGVFTGATGTNPSVRRGSYAWAGCRPATEAREDVGDSLPELRAHGDVVGAAPHRVLGHRLRAPHLFHAPVEIVEVRLQHLVAARAAVVQQHPDLLEGHACCLAPLDHGDADHVVLSVAAPAGGIPLRPQKTHRLPMTEHVGRQIEARCDIADGPRILRT
jgi:hypothetical protein